MATDRAATVTAAHKGPTRGQHETGRRKALLADLRAMVRKLGDVLEDRDAELAAKVADAHDPQESSRRVPAPGFVPMSRPRVRRVNLESTIVPKLQRARDLLKDALADSGYDWRD